MTNRKKNRKPWLLLALVLLCSGCSRAGGNVNEEVQLKAASAEQAEPLLLSVQEEAGEADSARNRSEQEAEAMDGTGISGEKASPGRSDTLESRVEEYVNAMTWEEKAAQLFVVLPEALIDGVDCVTAAGERTKAAIDGLPVGGFVYLSRNLQSEDQVRTMLSNIQTYSRERIGLPAFLCLDEEGGSVTRISGTGQFDVPLIEDMAVIGGTGDSSRAYQAGKEIGTYLSGLGFNVDFAPVADVLSNPENTVVKRRSFGTDAPLVSEMVLAFSRGLSEQGICSTLKHFPGHGATAGDTHAGYAYTNKTLDELRDCELVPFQAGVREGIPFIMVSHISLPTVIGDDTPASLSSFMLTDVLRKEMGYEGIIITDAMNMGAIVKQYSSADAAVRALQAGADVILMPDDFRAAYRGVLEAMERGQLSKERIDESLRRILRVKLTMEQNGSGS